MGNHPVDTSDSKGHRSSNQVQVSCLFSREQTQIPKSSAGAWGLVPSSGLSREQGNECAVGSQWWDCGPVPGVRLLIVLCMWSARACRTADRPTIVVDGFVFSNNEPERGDFMDLGCFLFHSKNNRRKVGSRKDRPLRSISPSPRRGV